MHTIEKIINDMLKKCCFLPFLGLEVLFKFFCHPGLADGIVNYFTP